MKKKTLLGVLALMLVVGTVGVGSAVQAQSTSTPTAATALAPAPSTGLPTANPEDVGMSSERLARIGPVMERHVNLGFLPGCITLVARHGKIVHFQGHGWMDYDAGVLMKDDAILIAGSQYAPQV